MKLTLIGRKVEAPRVESFVFNPAEPVEWKAGQFIQCVLEHEPMDSRGEERWFTIASAPSEKKLMITTRFANENGSSFKTALHALQIGETIEMSDLDGEFVIEDQTQSYVFIAGGIGITPFYSILKEADHAGVKLNATLLYGNRDDGIAFQQELQGFAENNPNLIIHHIIAPQRIDERLIRKVVADIQKPLFYVSGPEPMVESLGEVLKGMGVADDHLKQDFFPGYS
ncbi:FAD-dependent oxidoreductase [Pseudomonas sp. C27(2019)]|uniref:ferredoxin--NADP reductase n=1 Tax=Pseudomonas sp. C27(2019) TaxID=2604941 RepID=UPI001246FAF8|nr:FAD-dependent oxidoreductase [Pseudomonas sp. C27(2019)]QEY58240.1 FAD-dependent oxidoreductase [Pseudomonas sp. C27(2019)]